MPLNWFSLSQDLEKKGWALVKGWPDDALLQALKARALKLEAEDALKPAAVGPKSNEQIIERLRQTNIHWLDPDSPPEKEFLALTDTTKHLLNESFFLGLFDFEACFAIYPEGGFYKRHRDSFKGERNRVISFVTYLNWHWQAENGGELVIYDRQTGEAISILPEAGTSVFMLSEEIEHEVLPAKAPRYGIAGWWRVRPMDPLSTPQ